MSVDHSNCGAFDDEGNALAPDCSHRATPFQEECAQSGCRYCVHSKPLPGVKYDKDKPLFDLLPPYAIAAIVDVLTYGAKKYAPENWRKMKGWRWRFLGAALRHVFAYMQGHKIDPESGCLHLAHAACCLCFMLELDYVCGPNDKSGDER